MTIDISGLLARLQPTETSQPNQMKVLRCFTERGIATTDQVVTLSGLNYDAVYQNLLKLCRPQCGVGAALRSAQVSLEGERGKPRKVHILTDVGAAVLRATEEIADLRAPKLEEHSEIAAAVMMMDLFTAARQANLVAEIEKVLAFGEGGGSIRADVYIEFAQGLPSIFECEQNAAGWSKARLQDKLGRLVRFYRSEAGQHVQSDVRVLFNIHPDDIQTLLTWQEQLALVEREYGKPLPFNLHCQRISDFLKNPDWFSVSGFQPLVASALPAINPKAPPIAAYLLKGLPASLECSISDMKELELILGLMYRDQQDVFQQFRAAQNPLQRSLRFFALMLFIYEASHYRHSPAIDFATLPIESLYLLRQYLHAHQNAILLARIKQGLATVNKHVDGVTRYRNAMTQFIWTVFMRWHGFARGGALKIKVEPPGFDTGRSDFHVDVYVSNREMLNGRSFTRTLFEMEREEQALAWVLEAMVNYPTELGLD